MFTMMNNARLGVGVHALGAGEAAYQHALAYAMDRVQGARAGSGRHGDDPRPRRCAADADRDEGGYLRLLARSRSIWRSPSTWPPRRASLRGSRARRSLTPIAKNFGAETGMAVGRCRHSGPWRDGFHRGNRRGAIRPRRAGLGDLRGHHRDPGRRPRGAQSCRTAGLRPSRYWTRRGGRRRSRAIARLAGTVEALREATRALLEMEINDRPRRVRALRARLRADAGRALPCAGRDG